MTIPGYKPTPVILDPQDPRFEPLWLLQDFKRFLKSTRIHIHEFEDYSVGTWVDNRTQNQISHECLKKTVDDLLLIWEALELIERSERIFGSSTWKIATWTFTRGAKK